MKSRKFYTNLASPLDSLFSKMPYKGRGWQVEFGPNLELEDGAIYYYTNKGKPTPPKHIVIRAVSEETAKNAVDLILAASCMVNEDCGDALKPDNEHVFLWSENSDNQKIIYNLDNQPLVSEYQFACLVATRASSRKSFQYALMKYKLSQQLFNTRIDILDPAKWNPKKFVFNSALHHVRCAQPIALGYSVIEEIGLEIRATQKNPSFINGTWNPSVKTDLEQRLINSGINLSEKASWTMRDTPTKIERNRKVLKVGKASWAYRKVRDSEIEVVDAIAHASWLRSKISAHRLHEISTSLNYYDVSNMHYLSRRLFLESLGLWHPQKDE